MKHLIVIYGIDSYKCLDDCYSDNEITIISANKHRGFAVKLKHDAGIEMVDNNHRLVQKINTQWPNACIIFFCSFKDAQKPLSLNTHKEQILTDSWLVQLNSSKIIIYANNITNHHIRHFPQAHTTKEFILIKTHIHIQPPQNICFAGELNGGELFQLAIRGYTVTKHTQNHKEQPLTLDAIPFTLNPTTNHVPLCKELLFANLTQHLEHFVTTLRIHKVQIPDVLLNDGTIAHYISQQYAHSALYNALIITAQIDDESFQTLLHIILTSNTVLELLECANILESTTLVPSGNNTMIFLDWLTANNRPPCRHSALFYALKWNNVQLIERLIDAGTKYPINRMQIKETMFSLANTHTDLNTIKSLVAFTNNTFENHMHILNSIDTYGNTMLTNAVKCKNHDFALTLLEHNVDANILNHEQKSTLLYAVEQRPMHPTLVMALINASSAITLTTFDAKGKNALSYLTEKQCLEPITLIINALNKHELEELLTTCDILGHTPITLAIINTNTVDGCDYNTELPMEATQDDIATLLLSQCEHCVISHQDTAALILQHAIDCDHTTLITRLIHLITQTSPTQQKPVQQMALQLLHAAQTPNITAETFKKFVDYLQEEINCTEHIISSTAKHRASSLSSTTGNTALIHAAAHGYLEKVRILISFNADITLCNDQGNNALMQCIVQMPEQQEQNTQVINYLLATCTQHTSKLVTQKNNNGENCIHLIAHYGPDDDTLINAIYEQIYLVTQTKNTATDSATQFPSNTDNTQTGIPLSTQLLNDLDNSANTPLMYSMEHKKYAVLNWLLQSTKPDIPQQNKDNNITQEPIFQLHLKCLKTQTTNPEALYNQSYTNMLDTTMCRNAGITVLQQLYSAHYRHQAAQSHINAMQITQSPLQLEPIAQNSTNEPLLLDTWHTLEANQQGANIDDLEQCLRYAILNHQFNIAIIIIQYAHDNVNELAHNSTLAINIIEILRGAYSTDTNPDVLSPLVLATDIARHMKFDQNEQTVDANNNNYKQLLTLINLILQLKPQDSYDAHKAEIQLIMFHLTVIDSETLLDSASKWYTEVAKYNATTSILSTIPYNAVMCAARYGSINALTILLEDPNIPLQSTNQEQTLCALSYAIYSESLCKPTPCTNLLMDTVRSLENAQNSKNDTSQQGYINKGAINYVYPLITAMENNNLNALKQILQIRKTAYNDQDHNQKTILHHIAQHKNQTDAIQYLNTIGQCDEFAPVSFNSQDKHGRTPLICALKARNDKTAIAMLMPMLSSQTVVDINIADIKHKTALIYAPCVQNPKVLTLILKFKRVNPNLTTNNGIAALHMALHHRNDTALSLICKKDGVNLSIKYQHPFVHTPLTHTVLENKPRAMCTLLQHSANAALQDENGFTALMHAVAHGNTIIVKILLGYECNINAQSYNTQTTALMLAIKAHNIIITSMLLDAPTVNVLILNTEKHSALHIACKTGFTIGLRKLLDTIKASGGTLTQNTIQNLMTIAASNGQIEIMCLLMTFIAEHVENKQDIINHALISAASNKQCNMVQILLNPCNQDDPTETLKADPNYQDENGDCILQIAIHNIDINLASQILQYRQVSLYQANDRGNNTLMSAIRTNEFHIFHTVFTHIKEHCTIAEQQVIFSCVNNEGNNAIMLAAHCPNQQIIQSLLETHPSLANTQNNNKDTPLHIAAKLNNIMTMSVLLLNGTELNATNAEGDSALILAAKNSSINAVAKLVTSGADTKIKNHKKKNVSDYLNSKDITVPILQPILRFLPVKKTATTRRNLKKCCTVFAVLITTTLSSFILAAQFKAVQMPEHTPYALFITVLISMVAPILISMWDIAHAVPKNTLQLPMIINELNQNHQLTSTLN